MSAAAVAERVTPPERHDILSWITTTDHKRVGILYMATTMVFMAVAGLLAMAMRIQLARPGQTLIGPHAYNQIFTLHGTAMIFLVIAPFGLGLANYLIPLQIGAPDMAFPRLNATSFWLFLFGGLIVFGGAATNEGAAAAGWTSYVPLSEITVSTGLGQDFWIVGLALVSVASILTALNFVTTAFIFRAPGMTMWRLPIFTWEMIATALLVFMAFPSLTATLLLLFIDRRLGGHVFDPAFGGSAVLYQHLFWFFGHPEVYVLILPYFGIVSEIISTFSGRPLFGYTGMVLAAFAIAGLSMGVWAHHMFTTGAVNNPFFSFVSFLIAVPTGIKFFNWICTMWGGAIRYPTAMLYSVGFLVNFLVGGVTGVMVASPPLDFQAQDSYFVVAHFHYTIAGGSLFALLAALYYWWPKVYGWMLDERLGKIGFWFTFVGFNVTFLPMFFMGLFGMARRVYTYPDAGALPALNAVATAGAYLMLVGAILFVVNVVVSARRRVPAGDNPWEANTLEWATTSPPPEHNFDALPPIRSPRPLWDARRARPAGVAPEHGP
ncbi:MAG TPA: cytochrome c oxidase subunit I [Candidatus Elarobacter sp.]|nr:cytochrome c oxidase subunit I [Candidatus Elarobacter sp.]